MPFNVLRIKKVRRYDVATPALFLLPVQLLDNTIMECTMNSKSTGLQLLQHIAQRLTVGQWQYFGLKFINKHMQYQWLSLDQPLKHQLTKYAHQLHLKFSVRFYIRNINQFKIDDSTRYQFFLQLRSEIIEGALLCSAEQAVLLGAYSLQAAYGDFDVQHHSPRHLKDFYLLPKRTSLDDEALFESLIQVSDTHASFMGMAPAAAETYYIVEAQNLEGYGEEYYAAKESSGNDLLLGTSWKGVIIKHPSGRLILSIAWENLKSVTVTKKRSICLECSGTGRASQRVVQIFLENADFCAYVLSNILLQQEFYTNSLALASVSDFESSRLMFRHNPDPLGFANPMAGALYGGPQFSRPDVVLGAESHLIRHSIDSHHLSGDSGSKGSGTNDDLAAHGLVYREAPPYRDVVKGGYELSGHDDPLRADRSDSTEWPARATQAISTPELRSGVRSELSRPELSSSNPDLLCSTAPAILQRPNPAPSLVEPGTRNHLQKRRLPALEDLSTAILSDMSVSSPPLPNDAPSSAKISPASLSDASVPTNDVRRLDIQNRLSSGNLLIEFEQIPKKRPQNLDSCSVAMLPENRTRNRYPDLLPYDDTRIHLLNPTRKNPKGYLNASEIILKCQDLERRYVAAQEPIVGVTSDDFLSMLSQSDTCLVAVLSDDVCVPWALFVEGQQEVSVEGFHLRRESVSQAEGFRIVCFWLYDRRSKQSRRKIWAIHFYAWNEQGVPESVQEFYRMTQELESLRLQFHSSQRKDTVVVTCRTGSGRSGMLILFDFMRLCLDHNQNVDLARVLTHMRIQRMHMVQTVSQYRFVYTVLLEHLAGSRLI